MPEKHDEESLQRLWEEYRGGLRDFDDMSLARWAAQTLGQLKGRVWRLSHPLVGLHRLLAQETQRRSLRLRRLATAPAEYPEAPCCNAPLLPLVTRDVLHSGLICETCSRTAIAFGDIPGEFQTGLRNWAEQYDKVHAVAHWNENEKLACLNYEQSYNEAAEQAENLLSELASHILPPMLDVYPAMVWEDNDECLDVRPDDIEITRAGL
ncbi:MAG: hypothetical protein PHD76_00270 [Methylacidiphilales bacterium]|nr:hypothetical protein [Candidatus Methylacidiphilales bacterium]